MKTVKIERPVNILLVEDNEGDVRLITESMKEAGFRNEVIVAENGEAAIQLLRGSGKAKDLIDLIILDLNLPGKDGRDVLKDVKSDEKLKHIPVIVLTSSSADEDIEKCYNLYANCFISKPLELSGYTETVKKIEMFWLNLAKLSRKKIKLLIIEDNPADVRLVQELLGEIGNIDYDIDSVDSLADGIKRIASDGIDMILLDLNLPDSNGIETFHSLKAKFPTHPVVIFTGISDEDIGTQAVQEGAQSCLFKQDLRATELERTIRFSIERNKLKQATEDMMNIIVHELRAPLSIIKEGSLQVLEEIHGKLNESQKDFLQMVADNSNKMDEIIAELLDMARISIGKIELDMEDFDLAKEIKKVFKEFISIVKKSGVAFELNLQDGNFNIKGDKKRIVRIITNLLANALKFTEKGKVSLTLSDLGDKMLLCVEDTGVGMDPADIREAFVKYQQPIKTARARSKGIGLGLYICKNLVELHHGSIFAESELNKGTKFTVVLPRNRLTLF